MNSDNKKLLIRTLREALRILFLKKIPNAIHKYITQKNLHTQTYKACFLFYIDAEELTGQKWRRVLEKEDFLVHGEKIFSYRRL